MRSHVHKGAFRLGARIGPESSDAPSRPMLSGDTRNLGQYRLHTCSSSVALNHSRHNGVVIEPIDQDMAKSEAGSDEEGASPKQKPKSRNGTTPDTPSVTSHPQGISHTLPFPPNSHYYRQHTMPTGKARYRNFRRSLFHSQLGG